MRHRFDPTTGAWNPVSDRRGLKTTGILAGPLSNAGQEPVVPGGSIEPPNAILLASNEGGVTVTPPGWTLTPGADVTKQLNSQFDAGSALRWRRDPGNYPDQMDVGQLDPANTYAPIIHCPTWLYWTYDFEFDPNYLANTSAWGGGGALKNIYTLYTNTDYWESQGRGQTGSYDATIGHLCDPSLPQSPVPPFVSGYGATDLVQHYIDDYPLSGSVEIIDRGYPVPDAVINSGDLTHVFSAGGHFAPTSSGGDPIDSNRWFIGTIPRFNPDGTPNGLQPIQIAQWISVNEIRLSSAAPGPIAAGLMGVGQTAPYTGNQAPGWYPNVPPYQCPSATSIPAAIQWHAGTKRRIQFLQIANTDNNIDGRTQCALDNLGLISDWRVQRSSLQGRFWTTYFDQQTPFGNVGYLASPMGPTDTTLTMVTPLSSTWAASGKLRIDTEYLTYTSFNPSTGVYSGLTRGTDGTTAASHLAGTACNWTLVLASPFDTWLGHVRVSCGYWDSRDQPHQFTMTADNPTPAGGSTVHVTAQLVDLWPHPVRQGALAIHSTCSGAVSCTPLGDFGSGGSTDVYGKQIYTIVMPAAGQSVTLTVYDQASPARGGSITLTAH